MRKAHGQKITDRGYPLQPLDQLEQPVAEYSTPLNRSHAMGSLSRSEVVFSYYQGAHGPTLRIGVQSLEDLKELSDAIRKLSSCSVDRFSMWELRSVLFEPPLSAVILAVAPGGERASFPAKVSKLTGTDGLVRVHWVQTATEWEDTSGLVEGLSEAAGRGASGHQYLNDEERDGMLIELAFNE
jgi:hypothetical protein